MRLLPIFMALAGVAMISQANAAPTPPNLSNAQFQQCLSNLKNSSSFRGVASTL